MKSKLKENKAITLIALVITIIILLILAGVTLNLVMGKNGIIRKARSAKEETEKEEAREKIQVAVVGSYELDVYNVEKINKELGTDIKILPAVVEQNSFKFTIAKDGNVYDGKCLIGLTDKNNYGEYVSYGEDLDTNGETDDDWRIFYNDGKNVYLIADDYIEFSIAPAGRNETKLHVNDNTAEKHYRLSMSDIVNDYNGATDITDIRITKWLSYLNSNRTSSYHNMKAVAYMLDTSKNVWGKFANDYAEYAVGAPTLDLFCKSYNETHKDDTIDYQVNSNNIGYDVKKSINSDWTVNLRGINTDYNELYCISSNVKALEMWLASPRNYEDDVFGVTLYGVLEGCTNIGNINPGFRPIVCLKSNVQAKKDGDVWKFQN